MTRTGLVVDVIARGAVLLMSILGALAYFAVPFALLLAYMFGWP
jgi:hypothetical protein